MAGLEGKVLDRYELLRLIGRGGMADVYEAYDPKFERIVAVKVFKREEEAMLRRFVREAQLMASLANEHLVPVFDTGADELDHITWYFIVMPLMEGGTLRARIRRAPLSLPDACRCIREIADALDYIHSKGIIHRDIKASNVLLDAEGRCYLSDFGIARTTTDATQLTSTGNVLGTVEYVAPELFEGDNKANALSDLYSLGVLLFEMVTGRLPFMAENQIAIVTMHMTRRPPAPRSIVPQIPPQVDSVILKALEKRPELRYGSATELANAFCRAVTAGQNSRADIALAAPIPGGASNPEMTLAQQPLILGPVPETPPARVMPPQAAYAATPNVVEQPIRRVSARPPSRSRRRVLVVTIMALVILALLSVPIVLALNRSGSPNPNGTPTTSAQISATSGTQSVTPSPTATPNLTATANAATTATAVAQAHATATASARATATVVAQAQATAGVVQTATAGKPAYHDALNDPNNAATQSADWDQNSHCVFDSAGYHVEEGVNLVNLHGCREQANSYQNMAISVAMKLISGHSGGVFFRVSTDALGNYSGYLFEVDSTGRYKISNFSSGAPAVMQDWQASSALKPGYNVKNTLQVVARGANLSFYANGVYLTSVTDSSYTAGNVAFLATTTDTNADVVYSNLSIYSLS